MDINTHTEMIAGSKRLIRNTNGLYEWEVNCHISKRCPHCVEGNIQKREYRKVSSNGQPLLFSSEAGALAWAKENLDRSRIGEY